MTTDYARLFLAEAAFLFFFFVFAPFPNGALTGCFFMVFLVCLPAIRPQGGTRDP